MHLHENLFVENFFVTVSGLEFIHATWVQKASDAEFLPHGFCKIALFKILENLLRYFCEKHFLARLYAYNL